MRCDLTELLRCPVSGGALDLQRLDGGDGDEVETGILSCRESGLWYPVINHVPVMLTFRTPLVEAFAREHAGALAALGDYRCPDREPMPGEQAVQSSFTSQWRDLAEDELTFIYTDEELLALHRDVWLHLPSGGDPGPRRVLDVGCGFGREARVLKEIFPNALIVGVDLNLSLLRAAASHKEDPRLAFVIASLFHLPFADGGFDHVHCQGVLHHTYSTGAAFRAITRCVAPGGSEFIWVYAKEDGLMEPGPWGRLVRIYLAITHTVGRPLLSRLPAGLRDGLSAILALVLHPIYKWRSHHRRAWRYRNTLHSVRDIFTPRHAHLHGFNEVIAWFEQAGMTPVMQFPARYQALIGKRLRGIGVLGRRDG